MDLSLLIHSSIFASTCVNRGKHIKNLQKTVLVMYR